MLHKGILPHHTKWVKLFENLQYVIVDELHTHRGVYGSHVANIFRRLHRLCEFYGSRPQFLCSSATIGNPKELAESLTGREMTLIDQSGAPRPRSATSQPIKSSRTPTRTSNRSPKTMRRARR